MSSDLDSTVPPQWAGYIGNESLACAVTVLVVEICFLSLRAAAKYVTKSRLGWDDWLLIPTGLINIAMVAVIIAAQQYGGLGQHETAVYLEDPDTLVQYAKLLVAFACTYGAAMVFPRLVILTLYLRIFTGKYSRWATYTLMVTMSLYGVISIVVNLTSCIPLSALWDPMNTEARCIDLADWWSYSSIPNVAIDIGILVLPIRTVLTLKLPLRDRIGLMLTFTSGGIGTLACVARLFMFRYIPGAADDETWADVPLSIISMIEAMTYLIAACLPGLRPLYHYARRQGQYSERREYHLFSSLRRSRAGSFSLPSRKNSRRETTSFHSRKNSRNDPVLHAWRKSMGKDSASFASRNDSVDLAEVPPTFLAYHYVEPLFVRQPSQRGSGGPRTPHIAELHLNFPRGTGGVGR